MDTVGAIAVIILTLVLWVLSHKYFRFIYFGNIGNAILKELIECFVIALLLVSIVGALLNTILAGIGTVLLFLIKAAMVVAGVIVAIWLISVIAKALSSSKSEADDSGDSSSPAVERTSAENVPTDQLEHTAAPENGETDILAYIRENFTSSDYIKAIRYYREKTGADFEAARVAVDNILK